MAAGRASVRRAGAGALLILLPALAGCVDMTGYLVRQGAGQIGLLLTSVPIQDVLAAGTLDPDQQRRLELVVAARDFARDALGLNVGSSFTLYHDTGGRPVAYNLSAAQPDALLPRTWTFPLVGALEYIGFFDPQEAQAAAADLQAQGYDTFLYGVDAYSTLGWFPDPVQSTFLNRDDGPLVETVIHELAHNTIYAAGQSTFNESLATFIGREGARLFFAARAADGQAVIADLAQRYADEAWITDWMLQLEAELRAYYAQDLPRAAKIAGREAVFQAARERFTAEVLPRLNQPDRQRGWANLPTNNAFVLLHRRYHLDLDAFAAAYERAGGDFAAFLGVLRQAAASPDPFAALRAAGAP